MRALSLVTAASALLLIAMLPWINHFFLPSDARWIDITTNVVVITSVGFLTASLLGPLLGAVVAILLYAGFVVFSHAAPQLALYLPMSGVVGNLKPHFMFSGVMAILALTVWTTTRGESRLAQQLRRNEE